ncbi:membrane dipeptidase [Actinomadura madurae]|uniref:membrane dipeptidase n=1 Tax=Actinomadura madurae TaxID=1993 RepID=UPI0020D22EDF|nr:membrane dipeptidase [Actinomadura madurae]
MGADLHESAVVADAHNDLLMAVVARPPARWASFFRERWLPQLRAGGVDLQMLPVFIDDQFRPEGALRETLRMIECAHAIAEGNAEDVRLCLDGPQVDAALAEGKIALVLALESMPGWTRTSSSSRPCIGWASGSPRWRTGGAPRSPTAAARTPPRAV